MKAMFPGSYDPITNGHLDIIERAAKMFDELVIAVMVNDDKKTLFTTEERLSMIEDSVSHLHNVKAAASKRLTVEFADELGIHILIRGLRAVMDYEYELQQASANMMLSDHVESLFLISKPEYAIVSSSMVKIVASRQGNIDALVPEAVARKLRKAYAHD